MTTPTALPRHVAPAVPVSGAVLWLGVLIAVLALVVSLTGLFQAGGPGSTTVTTVRGDTAELLGHGLYRYDTAFSGAGFRGTDVVNVVLAVPALLVCLVLYRRGSLRGVVALIGAVTYFLYVYANLALGAAYNSLFLLYVALVGSGFYALVLLLRSIDLAEISTPALARLPRRGPAAFFLAAGLVTAVVWLLPLVTALAAGETPSRMDTYTTAVTFALDLAVITPACFITARLLLRRAALGYLVAAALLGIIVLLGPNFVAQTISQLRAGVEFSTGEAVGPIAGFGLVAAFGIWVFALILRRLPGRAELNARQPRPAADDDPTAPAAS
jgi:hypothetical protein